MAMRLYLRHRRKIPAHHNNYGARDPSPLGELTPTLCPLLDWSQIPTLQKGAEIRTVSEKTVEG